MMKKLSFIFVLIILSASLLFTSCSGVGGTVDDDSNNADGEHNGNLDGSEDNKDESQTLCEHVFGSWSVEEANCLKEGARYARCELCDYVKSEIIPIAGHRESEWIIDLYPTKDKAGDQHTECTVCGVIMNSGFISPTGSVGLAYSVNEDGESCTVTGIGKCDDVDLFIPDYIDGFKVTAIGEGAFFNHDYIKLVKISNTVKSIGAYAFRGCYGLTKLHIPASVTELCDGAFSYCQNLTELIIPKSVTVMGEGAFSNCWRLNTIKIFAEVSVIKKNTFNDCRSLLYLYIPDSVTVIEDDAFYGCNEIAYLYYNGSEEKWGQIEIGSLNNYFGSAQMTYNYDFLA